MGCTCNSEKSLKEKNNQQNLDENNNLKVYNQNDNLKQETQKINEPDQNENKENQKLTINKNIYTEETLPTETDLKKNKNFEKKEIQPIKEEEIKEEIQSMVFTPDNFNLELFNKLEIKKHNELRKKHHVDDLIINKELITIAQKHAEKIAKSKQFQHSNKKDRELKDHKGEWVGENIYYNWSSARPSYESGNASQSWYDEIKDYDFKKGGSSNGGVVGHFTQVVWKNTKEAGFGLAFNNNNECYVVGNYYPGGNFNNQEKNNVFPE